MAQQATFAKDHDVVTTRSKTGTPLGMVSYSEGYTGTIPEAHYADAKAAGVLSDQAQAGPQTRPQAQPAPAPAAPGTSQPGTVTKGVPVNDKPPAGQVDGGG